MPAGWRRSVSECLAVIDFRDARLAPLERELKPFAHADPRALLLDTIPGLAELVALTIAVGSAVANVDYKHEFPWG